MSSIKYRDILYFGILTGLHVCAVIQPTMEAHAKLNWNSADVVRSLCLKVSYQYKSSMLIMAMTYSLLMIFGLWYGRHRDAMTRKMNRQLLLERMRTTSKMRRTPRQLLTSQFYMAEWVRLRKADKAMEQLDAQLKQSEGTHFPWSKFLLFALPYTLTFVVTGLLNYGRLHLVIQHFCLSYWQTVKLYMNIQTLFLHHTMESLLDTYWRQLFGTVMEDPSNQDVNYISFETHLLAME